MTTMSRRPALIVLPLALSLLTACGESDKSKIKVAEVEDRVVTLDYYERKMNSMSPEYLPQDLMSREGRLELLEVMINKEVMAIKAEELGFGQDGVPDNQGRVVSEYKAAELMRADIAKDANNVGEDEIFEYYENLARSLKIAYMVFDYHDDAVEGKRLVEGGEDWASIARRLGAGDPGTYGDYTMKIKYGTVSDDVERAVFKLPVGAVSDPIDSVYGYFVIRIEGQEMERVQPLDHMRAGIIASIQKQKNQLAVSDFIDEVFAEYNFKIDDEVLKIAWDAIPPDVQLTPPPSIDQLPRLNIQPVDYEKVLMSWDGDVWTLKRYAEFFDNSSVFGRPRREKLVGGMRRKLKEIGVRELMTRAARDRGFTQLPEVRDEFKLRREQAMVTRLHDELVKGQIKVEPKEVDRWWDDNPGAFDRPERHVVRGIVTEGEQSALAVMVEAKGPGADFEALVQEHCVDPRLRHQRGLMGEFTSDDPSVIGRLAFELSNVGEISYPRELDGGRWAVLRLEEVIPASNPGLEQMRIEIGELIQREKEEALFQTRVEEWRSKLFIRIYEKNLDKAVYDPVVPKPQTITVGGGMPASSR
jgi:parvulin-like peptidyl-prolyl isomerase